MFDHPTRNRARAKAALARREPGYAGGREPASGSGSCGECARAESPAHQEFARREAGGRMRMRRESRLAGRTALLGAFSIRDEAAPSTSEHMAFGSGFSGKLAIERRISIASMPEPLGEHHASRSGRPCGESARKIAPKARVARE